MIVAIVMGLILVTVPISNMHAMINQGRYHQVQTSSLVEKKPCEILFDAIRMDNRDQLNRYIKDNNDINVCDSEGDTVLHRFVQQTEVFRLRNPEEMLAYLLSNGADPVVGNKKSLSPMHLAIQKKYTRALELFLKYVKDPAIFGHLLVFAVNQSKVPGALLESDRRIIMMLLEYGACQSCSEQGAALVPSACLHAASKELLDILVEHNASVDVLDSSEMSALSAIAQQKNDMKFARYAICFKTLLMHNAAINTEDVELVNRIKRVYTNPLSLACIMGDLQQVNTIVKESNLTDRPLMPLHWAAARGHCEIVDVLLDHKAPVNPFDMQGNTPADLAARNGHVSCVLKLLASGGALSNCCLTHSLVKKQDKEKLLELIKLDGKWLAERDKENRTSAHIAAAQPGTPLLDLLTGLGADVYAKNNNGITVLQTALTNPVRGTLSVTLQRAFAHRLPFLAKAPNALIKQVGDIPELLWHIAWHLVPTGSNLLYPQMRLDEGKVIACQLSDLATVTKKPVYSPLSNQNFVDLKHTS